MGWMGSHSFVVDLDVLSQEIYYNNKYSKQEVENGENHRTCCIRKRQA